MDNIPVGVPGEQEIHIFRRAVEVATNLNEYCLAVHIIGRAILPSAPRVAAHELTVFLDHARRTAPAETMLQIYEKVEALRGHQEFNNVLIDPTIVHVDLLTDAKDWDKAYAVARIASELDPDRGAVLEHRVEFLRKKDALPSRDAMAAYRLAGWAKQMGLYDEALRLLNQLKQNPQLRENVQLQIQNLTLEKEAAKFESIRQLFANKRIVEARRIAAEYRRENPQSLYCRKLDTLEELARYQDWASQRAQPAHAEAVYQQAERLALQNRNSEAVDALNRLQADYPDSAAAKAADKLRERVRAHETATTLPRTTP